MINIYIHKYIFNEIKKNGKLIIIYVVHVTMKSFPNTLQFIFAIYRIYIIKVFLFEIEYVTTNYAYD